VRVSFAPVRGVAGLLLCCVTIQSAPASAAETSPQLAPRSAPQSAATPVATPTPAAKANPLTRDRGVAAGLAMVPGLALHGSGHYALGHEKTARALFITEGIAVALTLAGYATLRASGNSRHLAGPALAATVFGAGLIFASFGADLYGTLANDGGALDSRLRAPARFESEFGYRYVADPHFSYGGFVVQSLTLREAGFRFTPSAWFANDSSNVRYRVEAAYRLQGLEPGQVGPLDDHVEIVLGALHQRFLPEHFRRSGVEFTLDTRFDFAHFGDTLRGSFIDLSLGYGRAKVSYDLAGLQIPSDTDDLLLARMGLGVALRGRAESGSEVRVYYDHRHDDYAAGLLTPGRISGVFGKLGADLRWFFTPRLGLLLDAQVGSAFVGGLSLLFRESRLQPGASSR